MNLSPIVLFVYNRPWHTQQTVEALQKNELASESELVIYADGAKNEEGKENVDEVRRYIETVEGFRKVTIIKREKNWGLAESIIDGVTSIVNSYGKIIVLEDDLVTSPYFLKFMNEALEMYKDEMKVASIHGYIYPIEELPGTFFIRGADCWGWATWKRAWDIFEEDGAKLLSQVNSRGVQNDIDFNGNYPYVKMLKNQIKSKNNSWAIRWYVSAFLKNMLTLYPGKSYIQNIGNDDSGTHCGSNDSFRVDLNNKLELKRINIQEDKKVRKKIELFLSGIRVSFLSSLKSKIKRVLFK